MMLVLRIPGETKPFKLKMGTQKPFSKLKEVFCDKFGYQAKDVDFIMDGDVIGPDDTPEEFELEDDDIIDVRIKNGALPNRASTNGESSGGDGGGGSGNSNSSNSSRSDSSRSSGSGSSSSGSGSGSGSKNSSSSSFTLPVASAAKDPDKPIVLRVYPSATATKSKKFRVKQGSRLRKLHEGMTNTFKLPDTSRLLLPARMGGGEVDLQRSALSYGLLEGDELRAAP